MKNCSWITVRAGSASGWRPPAGFSLAHHLADQLHYPVGIVDLALEGSVIYSWISRKSFEADEELSAVLRNRQFISRNPTGSRNPAAQAPHTAEAAASGPEAVTHSPDKDKAEAFNAAKQQGNRKILSALPKPHVDKAVPPLPDIPRERRMTALYNHKIYPLRSMSIRGIVFAPDARDSAAYRRI